MQRGNLVIYDKTGKIFSQTGEAEGAVLPHEYPVGIPYIEIPFGTMATKRVVRIDVSGPNNHIPILEDIEIQKTPEEIIEELQAELAQYEQST